MRLKRALECCRTPDQRQNRKHIGKQGGKAESLIGEQGKLAQRQVLIGNRGGDNRTQVSRGTGGQRGVDTGQQGVKSHSDT